MAGTARQARRMTQELPLGRDAASVRQRVEAAEKLLERTFTVPGINQPVGLDAIVGLVPVAGDVVGALMGLYLIWEARNLKMPKWQQARMLGHVGLDAALGAVPFVGDLFDFVYRSNSRNLKIIRKHLDRHHPASRVIDA
jgi:hypothetical protein